jgi:hypothetical protein
LDSIGNCRAFLRGRSDPKYEIVVLKRNTHDLKNPEDYVRFDEYRKVFQGFQAALHALHSWILEEVAKFNDRSSVAERSRHTAM